MPIQMIDLRSFIRTQISTDTVDRRMTAPANLEAGTTGYNVVDMASTQRLNPDEIINNDGNQYVVVGFNIVGDGSVVGP